MKIKDFSKCVNCGACYQACPVKAITVDTASFFYQPKIQPDLCMDCGRCGSVCPLDQKEAWLPREAWAGWHRDAEVVLQSSSGGVFHGLAEAVAGQGGIIFGAAFAPDMRTVEITDSDHVTLKELQKSKYVESIPGNAYCQIESALKGGRKVLFCGTPCQVAGLKGFLGTAYSHLITCDFACGGLPSHKIYRRYLEALEQRYGSKVAQVDFRPKTHGWKRHAMWVRFQNGRTYNKLAQLDPYLKAFLHGRYTVRDACLECGFSDRHVSDLTLADFWRHQTLSDLEHPDGISLVLVNSEKGRELLESISDQYIWKKTDTGPAAYNHRPAVTTREKKEKNAAFRRCAEQEGLRRACRRFLPSGVKESIKRNILQILARKRKGPK